MARIRMLSDEDLVKHIQYELKFGRQLRKRLRVEWDIAEHIYQGVQTTVTEGGVDSDQAIAEFAGTRLRQNETPNVQSTHLTRAMLFLHSKLSIVEPDVVARPFTREWPDKKAANMAQFVIEHFKNVQEVQDKLEGGAYLSLVKRGSCVTYQGWDEDAGTVKEADESFNAEEDEIEMTGDFVFRVVNCDNFFIDSTATRFEDALSCIEQMWIPVVKFKYILGGLVEKGLLTQEVADETFRKVLANRDNTDSNQLDSNDKTKSNAAVPVYFYWERAMPWNGMLGTFCFFVEDAAHSTSENEPADLIILKRSEHPFDHKQLPYAFASDLPIEDSPFGMSRAVQTSHVHDIINQMYSMILDNVELHGGVFLVKPEDSTNDAVEQTNRAKIITYNPASGGQIYHLKPSNVATDVWKVVDDLKGEIDAFFGQGEFSRGEINRELSSYAVQLGIEMDDKYRIALFNSKKKMLKRIYTQIISIAKQYVTEQRMLMITGSEFMFEYPFFEGADLEGNYDITVEFGKYMPVDPSARKQMVLELINNGAFEKAGGNVKKLFKILLEGDMFDIVEVFDQAKRIQEAEIAKMLDGVEVPIQEWQEDSAHKEALEDFMQTAFFEKLDNDTQVRIWNHYELHSNRQAEREAKANVQSTEGGGGEQGLNVNPEQLTAPGANIPPEEGGAGIIAPM